MNENIVPFKPLEFEPGLSSDELLHLYARALIRAQTTRMLTDWCEAGRAFDRFLDRLMYEREEEELRKIPAPIPVTF